MTRPRSPQQPRGGPADGLAFLGSIYENIPNMVFVKDARELRFVSFNRAAEQLLGYSRAELIGKNDYDFFPRDEADFFTAKDRAVLAGCEPVDIPEEPIHTRHHGARILHTKKVPILGPDGIPEFLLGISEDITELKRVESLLRESERQMRELLEAIPDLIFRIDRSGRFLSYVSAKGIHPMGPDTKLVGRDFEAALPPVVAARCREKLEQAFATSETQVLEFEAAEQGETRSFEVRIVPGGTDDAVGIVREITDRRRAEERARQHQGELAHAGRISTMGEMATGIAHELNQPLSAIVNHAEACMLAIRAGQAERAPLLEDLTAIASQAERATQIIRHLRSFVRKGGRRRSTTDLNEVVQSTVDFVTFEARDQGISLEMDLAGQPVLVSGDPVELQQVVLNLVRNSIEAMASYSGERTARVSTRIAGAETELLVRDRGPLLSAETVERFFTPYFSTKVDGLGLGLSISRSIVEGHGGQLLGEANPEGGATLRVVLPRAGVDGHDG